MKRHMLAAFPLLSIVVVSGFSTVTELKAWEGRVLMILFYVFSNNNELTTCSMYHYFPGLILNLVVANFPGGVHSDLGDPLRLPVPQVVRRHRQIRQGVRPRRLGPRQPGRSSATFLVSPQFAPQ